MDTSPVFRFDLRRAAAITAVQLALVAAAVVVSQFGPSGGATLWIVLGLTAINGLLVAVLLLGVRRSGPMVSALAVVTAIFVLGLLAWPAWDVYERMRP